MSEYQIRMAIFAVLKAIGMANAMHNLVVVDGPVNKQVMRFGSACRHSTRESSQWWGFASDVDEDEILLLEEAARVQDHGNKFHIGCPEGPDVYMIKGASWLVEYQQLKLPRITVSSSITEDEMKDLVKNLTR